MSFTIVDCEQRTPAWYAARAGVLTASAAAKMLAKPKKGAGELVGRSELRLRLAMEAVYGTPIEEHTFESHWMERGRALESAGIATFEALTGELVQPVGFLRHDTLPIGCSPDGILGDYVGGLELKCPKFSTHWEYLQLDGAVPPEYLPQIIHSLFTTDLPFWEFVSYSPEFQGSARIYRARVLRESVDLAGYALAFSLFWSEVETVMAALRARSAA